MGEINAFLVGGAVRDNLLGLVTKDYDFTVVVSDASEDEAWTAMQNFVSERSREVFLEKREFGTIRALVSHEFIARFVDLPGTRKTRDFYPADFVLSRKDGYYSDGRRPDSVQAGSLADDLLRRDFTVNALALSAERELIDYSNGQHDLENKQLRAVGDPVTRLTEDALRAVRALRFAITKGFNIEFELSSAMHHKLVLDSLANGTVSAERIREELLRCFQFDTMSTLRHLHRFNLLSEAMFDGDQVWLKPTMEDK